MKELHNHIFSNTTCISKETMLKYINNQLSVKELHEVEKHMLDCDLCTDALAGIKYAQNSSMLFAIDNQIDQRVRMGQNKAPLMRNLMVAASLLIIVFGSYFTFNFFNETVDSDANLAVKKEKVLEEDKLDVPLTETTKNKDTRATGEAPTIVDELANEASFKRQEQVMDATTLVLEDAEAEEVMEESPVSLDANEITLADDFEEVENDEIEVTGNANRNDQYGAAVEQQNAPSPAGYTSSSTKPNKDYDNLNKNALGNTSNKRDKAKEERKAKAKKGNSKKRSANAPAYKAEAEMLFAAEEKLEEPAKEPRTTITLSDHKVVNYIDEYQQAFDAKQIIETKSVAADFESEDRMAEVEKEREEEIIKITYKATLEKAMAYYKAKKYRMALSEFDVILKEHNDEVNALFYGGLSYYHLNSNKEALTKLDKVLVNKKTEFNQEAKWYKALTLIKLKQTDKAKNLLQQIVAEKGFYKTKAEEKLKGL